MVLWRRPKNILKDLPVTKITASGFDTAPTNLRACVDGDYSVATGQGSKNQSGAGYYGYITFDLGSVKLVEIAGRVGIWSAAGAVQVSVDSSDDNSTWRTGTIAQATATSVTEAVRELVGAITMGRYIRLAFYVGASANTANCKVYEITAHERTL